MANFNLEIYRNMLCTLHCQSSAGVITVAKPMMVLALIKMIDKSLAANNRFHIEDMEGEYNILNQLYGKTTPFQYPTYFLERDGFYHLKWKGERIKTHTPSGKLVRENIEYAYLDNALWDLLQDKETRDYLKETVINYYLK